MPRLHNQKKRTGAFKELKFCFTKKQWSAFATLALTQIEGVFSEMQEIVNPRKNKLFSLRDKVNTIRPGSNHHQDYLDYFQYRLPELRNSLLHYGNFDESKLKILALDLLYDLHFTMYFFEHLEDPFIELKSILLKRDPLMFHSISEYNQMFDLVDKVKSKNLMHFREIEDEWNTYNKEILCDTDHLEFLVLKTVEELPDKMKTYFPVIDILFYQKVDLSTLTNQELANQSKEIIDHIIDIESLAMNLMWLGVENPAILTRQFRSKLTTPFRGILTT